MIERLKKLLVKCKHTPDIIAFEEWAMHAEEIRPLRNYYVHASWGYLPLREESPLEFRVPRKIAGTMRIEDFEAEAARIEAGFDEIQPNRWQYSA